MSVNDTRHRPRLPGPRGGPGGPAMGMPVEKPKNFKGTLARLSDYLMPHRWKLAGAILITICSNAISIAGPKILGKVTTKLWEGVSGKALGLDASFDFPYIYRTLAVLAGLYLASAIFTYFQQATMVSLSQDTVYRMRREVSRKLSRLPLKYYDSHTHGEILSRVTNDIDTVSSTLQQSLTQLISSGVTMVGVLIMMVSISRTLTLAVLITLPLSVFVTRVIARRSQKLFAEQQRTLGELNGHIEEMYSGHVVVKAFGREREATERFREINSRLFSCGWKAQFVSGILMPLMNLIGNLGYVIVSIVGAVYVTRGQVKIGDIQAFISYARQFTQPIVQTANIANIIQSTVAAAERVFEVLDEPEEIPDPEKPQVIVEKKGEVRFEHVKFGYNEGSILMEDLNIHVLPGQTVAIVGPTGAGKTTLVNLLMRFYDVLDGRITIDGVDIRSMRREDLRSLFGMVLQDTWLFQGTIRENIAYSQPGASLDEIKAAATAARADHFIRTLPQGYETVLGENSTSLSQGQMQLVTIARAVLAKPLILILDEATSSVDTRTELRIQAAMEQLMKGRTSFVIAHRLSTIRNADLILVIDNGKIVEQGTHKELLERNGFYATLYRSQFTGQQKAAS